MYTLIVTANFNDVDPRVWLADVLARIAELPPTRGHELLPWKSRRSEDHLPGSGVRPWAQPIPSRSRKARGVTTVRMKDSG